MQLSNASQNAAAIAVPTMAAQPPARAATPAGRPEACGWYDSSFDLASGLDVSEENCDVLFQVWRLARH